MTEVLLATAAHLDFADARADEDALIALLADRGISAAHAVWDDPSSAWDAARLVVVRTTWDYTARLPEFLAWAEKVAGVTRLENPIAVLRWNTHKGYLAELEARGVPVVATAWAQQDGPIDLAAVMATRGWDAAVVKPAVSAGARGTITVGAAPRAVGIEAAQAHLATLVSVGDAMVQQYLPAIVDGEVSVLFVDGHATHAVRKWPAGGDFRVQVQFGGGVEALPLAAAPVAVAAAALAATRTRTLYARVDLVGGLVIEVELVEPALFLADAPDAAARMADAIVGRLS